MKKKILFFHRAQLTDFYIKLSKSLEKDFIIIHVAYSDVEYNKIIEARITTNVIHMVKSISKIMSENKNVNHNIIEEIDSVFLNETNDRFNLNSSIQSDRGFSILNYKQSLLLSQTYYLFWKNIFTETKVDFVFHEPPALFFIHICASLCKKYGGQFLWYYSAIGETTKGYYLNILGDDNSCPEISTKIENYYNDKNIDNVRVEKFLQEFRKSYELFLGNIINPKINFLSLSWSVLKSEIKRKFRSNPNDILANNIGYWLFEQRRLRDKLFNVIDYKRYKVKFHDLPQGENYYYYPLHLEPEAVVLYLADGLYTNQIKLIENIAAALPPDTYLYVKDHPHEFAYRNVNDYLRLHAIPNIKLLKSEIPGKQVIKDAIGVITINGTAGFEGLLLGKQVYTFGKTFYSSQNRVTYIENIRDLRKAIYKNRDVVYNSDKDLYPFVHAYLNSLHTGVIDYFNNRIGLYGINEDENANKIASDFIEFSKIYKQ